MAKSKHSRKAVPRTRGRLQIGNRTAVISEEFRHQKPMPGQVAPTEEELRAALGAVPDDLNWDWAAPRLAPIFERVNGEGIPGDPQLHTVTQLGVAVGFGIEIGPTLVRVTQSMADRWEASLEQIEAAAFNHLDRVVRPLTPRVLQHAVHRGHMARALTDPAGWASSVILAGEDAVRRIFGAHDQVLTAPARNVLLSFDAMTPPSAIFEITVTLEEADPHPLMLDPFRLTDGRLSWDGLVEMDLEDLLRD